MIEGSEAFGVTSEENATGATSNQLQYGITAMAAVGGCVCQLPREKTKNLQSN